MSPGSCIGPLFILGRLDSFLSGLGLGRVGAAAAMLRAAAVSLGVALGILVVWVQRRSGVERSKAAKGEYKRMQEQDKAPKELTLNLVTSVLLINALTVMLDTSIVLHRRGSLVKLVPSVGIRLEMCEHHFVDMTIKINENFGTDENGSLSLELVHAGGGSNPVLVAFISLGG